MINTGNKKQAKKLKKYILFNLGLIKVGLKFYLRKDWLTTTAYEILHNDLNILINQIKQEGNI